MSESKYQNPTLFDKTKKYVVSQLKDGSNVLPKLNAQNLYGFNLGNGIWENEGKINLNIGDGFAFDEEGKVIPDSNKLVFINEEGKISADLIPSEILNSDASVKILDDDDDRTAIQEPDINSLYFVKSTKVIWYYQTRWYYVSGMPTGGNTNSISVSVSQSNEITANIKLSESNLANLFTIKTDGLYLDTNILGIDTFALKSKIERYGQEGYGLSKNDFTNAHKTLLDKLSTDITTVIPYASESVAGLIKVGTGLSIIDGVLSVGGTGEDNTVFSVNNKTGHVTLEKGDIGLENVDNTSDKNKPVSDATWTELNKKVYELKYIPESRKVQVNKNNYNSVTKTFSESWEDAFALSGFLTDVVKVPATTGAKAYYKFKKDGSDLDITIPSANDLVSGNFDAQTNNLKLQLEDGKEITVYLPVVTNTYTATDTSTIDLTIDANNVISGEVNISQEENNLLSKKSDGLFVEKPNLDDYIKKDDTTIVKKSDLNDYVKSETLDDYVSYVDFNESNHIHPNKDVLDRFSTNSDNELTYNGNTFASMKVFSNDVNFGPDTEVMSWNINRDILTIKHDLGTSNIISTVLVENGKIYNISPVIIDSNNIKIKIPEFLMNKSLVLKITGV